MRRLGWKPLSIAASIIVLCVLGLQLVGSEPNIKEQIVEISPEVSQTEFYFASLIEEQVQQLKTYKSPETEQLVDDTLKQLNRLEEDYNGLEQELVDGGDSKLILNAMINNFQTRIDLLKEVLTTIESIKNLRYILDLNVIDSDINSLLIYELLKFKLFLKIYLFVYKC